MKKSSSQVCVVTFSLLIMIVLICNCGRKEKKDDSEKTKNLNHKIHHDKVINKIFETIRTDRVLLNSFISSMPKGGDLHHHYAGALYPETYMEYLIEENYFINTDNLEVSKEIFWNDSWVSFSELKKSGRLEYYREKIIKQWFEKNQEYEFYQSKSYPHKATSIIDAVVEKTLEKGLLEIKSRAKKENLSYVETIFRPIKISNDLSDLQSENQDLITSQAKKNWREINKIFSILYKKLETKNIKKYAIDHNKNLIERLHKNLGIDDDNFRMRYHNYVSRGSDPVKVFTDLFLAFESASNSPFVVGVNIVSKENSYVAIRDYWLHMNMYNFFRKIYPGVKCSLHAGELSMGCTKPEDLTWHVYYAVHTARANRIGHGVDIAYENSCFELLDYMRQNDIAVEISLTSNESLLKIKDRDHPILLYKKFGVPIVIGTDNAGFLRTSITDQYSLIACRYPEIKYQDIKQFVYNSIKYSFIDNKKKEYLIDKLDGDFSFFEKNIKNTLSLSPVRHKQTH